MSSTQPPSNDPNPYAPGSSVGPNPYAAPVAPTLDVNAARALITSPRGGMRIGQLMMLIAGLALVFWVIAVARSPLVFAGAIFLVMTTGVGASVVLSRRRGSDQEAILRVLTIASTRRLPLAPAISACAEQCSGRTRRDALAAASLIEHGASLPQALDLLPGLLAKETETIVRVGCDSDLAAEAFRDAAELAERQTLPVGWRPLSTTIAYLAGVFLMLQVVLSFLMYFIMPKMQAIANDFGVPLPRISIALIQFSASIVRYFFLVPFLVLFETALTTFLILSIFDLVTWVPWPFSRLLARRRAALVMRSLAIVVEGGKPLATGLASLARHIPYESTRRRIERALSDIDQGVDWADALRSRGLVSPTDAAIFESARRVGNLPWALRHAAESAERRHAYRLQGAILLLFPICIAGLGLMVFVVAAAYFAPLVQIIARLTP